MVDGKCWQCKFYNSNRRGDGECRRMPPPWRFVDADDWCGEFCSTQRTTNICPKCGGENGKHKLDCQVAHNMLTDNTSR